MLASFSSMMLVCNIYFLKTAFCMQVSSFGCAEATDQQISYPLGLILWFIFLMLLPLFHVSSPESLCSAPSCALQVWQEKCLINQNVWLAGPYGRGHLLCLPGEGRKKPFIPCNVHTIELQRTSRDMEKCRLPV